MITATLIHDLQSRDVRFDLDGEKVKVDAPPGVLTPEVKTLLTYDKPALVHLLRRPVDAVYYHERFHERAGIVETDDFMPREEAELRAFREVLCEYVGTHYPLVMEELERFIFPPEVH